MASYLLYCSVVLDWHLVHDSCRQNCCRFDIYFSRLFSDAMDGREEGWHPGPALLKKISSRYIEIFSLEVNASRYIKIQIHKLRDEKNCLQYFVFAKEA